MPQQKDVLFTFRLPVKYLKAKYLSRNFNTTMWGRNTRRTRHNVSEETSQKFKLRRPKKMWEGNTEENWW